jgi:DUF4097 and DUF4098 domain-containing protein YvlB
VVLAVPLGLAWAAAPRQLEKTFDTTLSPHISLSNLRGRVMVKGWDHPEVHALCTTNSPRVEVETNFFPPTGPTEKIQFTTQVLDPLVTGEEERADYWLDVPMGSSVEIRNRQGAVQIERLTQNTWVESVGGTITATDVAGQLTVRSVGGDIEIVRPSGEVQAHSITGSLHFVSATSPKLLRGRTTSGKITYEGDFAPRGDYLLSSYSGDLNITCPTSASFELRAKTVKGKLDNAFAITSRRQSASPLLSANSLVGVRNTGRARVELTSFSGTIHIRPQP